MAFTVAVDLSTIGMKVGIAFEETAGTRPSTKYYNLQKPKSIPDMNPEPETIDTTSLNATQYMTSVPGLMDLSGALGFTFQMSQALIDTWGKVCDEDDKLKKENKRLWLEIWHPSLTKAWFLPVSPSRLGLPAAEVNSAWDATVNMTLIGEIVMEEAIEPTDEDFTASEAV